MEALAIFQSWRRCHVLQASQALRWDDLFQLGFRTQNYQRRDPCNLAGVESTTLTLLGWRSLSLAVDV